MPYSGDPSDSLIDEVRFRIGDTDTDEEFLTDDEIAYLLGQESDNVSRAAVRGCKRIAAELSRQVNYRMHGVSVDAKDLAKQFRDLATELETEAALLSVAEPFAGGISVADKQAREADSDRSTPSFKRGLHDHP
jgi:hypothetical protein